MRTSQQLSRLPYAVLVALVLAYATVLCLFPVISNDVFFYLEIGRRFFSGEGVPTSDIFLFTGDNSTLDCYHELGAMLFFYLAYAAGGFAGLIFAKTGLILATAALPFWISWRLDPARRPSLLPVLSFFAVYGASSRYLERGSLFTDLFSVLFVGLVVAIRAGAGPLRVYRSAIPPLFLVWVNFHAGFLVGFLILLAWVLAEAANYLFAGAAARPAARERLSGAALTTTAAALFGLLNPRGVHAYGLVARVLLDPTLQYTRQQNPEFMTPFAQGYVNFLHIQVFIGVMLACLFLAATRVVRTLVHRRLRELPLFEALCLCIFAVFGFSMTRFIITAAFGALAVAAALLTSIEEPQRGSAGETWARRLGLPAMGIAIVASILWVVARGYGSGFPTRRIGVGVDLAKKPVRACDFIDRAGVAGNIFNMYEFGGYMIWRWQGQRKVFAHGFVSDGVYLRDEYLAIDRSADDFARIVARHRISVFLLKSVLSYNQSSLPLSHRILLADRRWRIAYADAVATLYVRDPPERREDGAQHSVGPCGPGNDDFSRADGAKPRRILARRTYDEE